MGKHLDFYKTYIQSGEMPYHYGIYNGGLCGIAYSSGLIDKELLRLFEPTTEDAIKYKITQSGYWGYDTKGLGYPTTFTPLRQTIVLFMAAMNGEL